MRQLLNLSFRYLTGAGLSACMLALSCLQLTAQSTFSSETPTAAYRKLSDLLRTLEEGASPDTALVKAYLHLAQQVETLPIQAIAYADSATVWSQRLGYPLGEVLASNRRIVPELLRGNHLRALSLGRKVLAQVDFTDHPEEHLCALRNLAWVLIELQSPQEAQKHYSELLVRARTHGNSTMVCMALAGLGRCAAALGQRQEAMTYTTQALQRAQNADMQLTAHVLVDLAATLRSDGQLALAHERLAQATAEARHASDLFALVKSLSEQGRLALAEAQPQVATRVGEEGLSIARRLCFVRAELDLLRILSQANAAQGRYVQAQEWQNQSARIIDSLAARTPTQQYAEVLAALDVEQTDNQFEERELELARSRRVQWSLIGWLVVLIGFVAVAGRALSNVRRVRRQLGEQMVKTNTTTAELKRALEEVELKNESLHVASRELELTNARLVDLRQQISADAASMVQNLEVAKQIQRALLPNAAAMGAAFVDHFILYRPRDVVSGDFYWLQQVSGRTIFAAIDCTGHGVPGAFMTMIAHSLLSQIILDRGVMEPGAILTELHKGIRRSLKQDRNDSRDGLDIALCVIDPRQKSLGFAGANLSLAYTHRGQLYELKPDKYSVGGVQHEQLRSFATSYVLYDPEHVFYIFSDGVYHQFGGPQKRKLSIARFSQMLVQTQRESLAEQRDLLLTTLDEWRGKLRQLDDWMVLGFRLD